MVHELLRVEDLVIEREGISRLHHMSFSVMAGVSAGLIGLSGGGKMTLAKVLCGEIEPDRGRLIQEGKPLLKEQLAQMSVRFSGESRLLENMSVQENLMVLGRPLDTKGVFIHWRQIRNECQRMLAEFGLEEYLDMPAAKIPVPVQHQLLLIGAAAQGKQLVILEHIADAYSTSEAGQLSACIRRLCQKGVAVLYLSGHLDSILWHLDRITVIRDGRRIKELHQGGFTEAALRTYMYGYRSPAEIQEENRGNHEVAFIMDNVEVPEHGLLPIHDMDGSVKWFLERLKESSGRTSVYLTADSLFNSWVEEMSALDNLLLPVAQRLSGPGFYVRRSIRQLLRTECMEQTGLSFEQMDQPVGWLNRMERFKLLQYRIMINRTDICVLDRITSGADLQNREEMRRSAGNLPGILFYISGDYRELKAFEVQIYTLQNGHLRKESAS